MSQDTLSPLDKRILDRLQADFPLESRPYEVIGRELNISEDQVLERVRALREEGYIRRLGGNFNSRALGYSSVLCAAEVPAEKLPAFIAAVNQRPGVTHNYLRAGRLNVWFTYIGRSPEEVYETVEAVKAESGVDDIQVLPSEKLYKIDVRFKLSP